MKYVSTRGKSDAVGFSEAFANGLAPDGGLYVPEHLPSIPSDLLIEETPMPYPALAWDLFSFFDSDHDSEELIALIDESYGSFAETMTAPLQQLAENLFILELFHGPTMSFKDVGARFMARCIAHLDQGSDKGVTVLVATSGDTGSAVANGFWGVEGINVVILYPSGKVSHIQEQQLTTMGGNVVALPAGYPALVLRREVIDEDVALLAALRYVGEPP